MNNEQITKQLQEIYDAFVSSVRTVADICHAIEAIHDPDGAAKKARKYADEHWQKYLAERETVKRLLSTESKVEHIYGELEQPIGELQYIANAWRDASDESTIWYLAGEMADKAAEIRKIYYSEAKEGEATDVVSERLAA
jgi:hypothetical protein